MDFSEITITRPAPSEREKSKKEKSLRRSRIIDAIWSNALAVILSLVWLIPVVYVILFSFSDQTNFTSTSIFPTGYTVDNYVRLFNEVDDTIQFPTWYRNTLFISIINCVLVTFFTVITAFIMSRFRFKGRKALMNITMILGMFPGFMSMVAVTAILSSMGLMGSYWGMILYWAAGAGMGFFVTKGYFDTISNDIDEAAKLDGASQCRLFFQIYIPLAAPIIIYTALTAFMAPWSDYILSSIILMNNQATMGTIGPGLYGLLSSSRYLNTYFTRFCAASVIVAAPIVAIYIGLQRFFIAGISAGAVKG